MHIILFFMDKVKRFINKFRKIEELIVVDDEHIDEHPGIINSRVALDPEIINDTSLKFIEKYCLLVLINNYNVDKGFVEISTNKLMDILNNKNKNQVIGYIKALVDKDVLKVVFNEPGKTKRYAIAKYMSYIKLEEDEIERIKRVASVNEQDINYNKLRSNKNDTSVDCDTSRIELTGDKTKKLIEIDEKLKLCSDCILSKVSCVTENEIQEVFKNNIDILTATIKANKRIYNKIYTNINN